MAEEREVLIVGAGPAGAGLAALLAQQGRDVLLVDRADFPRDKTCGDGVSPRALRVLDQLGLREAVLQAGWRINQIILFSPNGRPLQARVPGCGDLPDFAVVLPRYQLDDAIRRAAVRAGAEFRPQVDVTGLIQQGGRYVGVRADTPAGPSELRARLTVLATGAAVAVLQRGGLLARPPEFARAARAYYENVQGISDAVEFHFDSVPLPGYGWVFPTSATSANVGAGYLVTRGPTQPRAPRSSPRQAFDEFIANPYIARLLVGARLASPIKGYPLRLDFPSARTAFPGLRLVGEACGLVNPLTGEGIDYALESAEVAAGLVPEALAAPEREAQHAQRYYQALRDRFLRTFANIVRVRELYLKPWVLNRFVAAGNRHEDLKLLLIHIALGNVDPARALAPRTLLQVALG